MRLALVSIPLILFFGIFFNLVGNSSITSAQFYADNADTQGNNSTDTQSTNSSDYTAANIVLLSQKYKRGSFGYNDIVGQVKNIGNDTATSVRIDITTYDKTGGVLGTDFTYATADTLKPNQKSSFDLSSSKDNFKGMKSYELALQWSDPDGSEQYTENAKVYKQNSTTAVSDSQR